MKTFRFLSLFWLLSVAALQAQVTVEIQPEQEQYLQGEPLFVAVRITNLSGQTLALGIDADWLTFSVESREGFMVSELQKIPVVGEFALDSSKAAVKRVDLLPGFDFGRPGRYSVTATLHVKDWNQDFASKPKLFDIIPGSKIWQQEFGVPPQADHPNEVPEVRKYALQQANYLKQLKLYLQITDAADTKIIKVLSLGPMVQVSRPEPQLDKFNNLHVLWQIGAKSFAYRVVNPNGEIIVKQTHEYLGTRPRLSVNEQGDIVVVGGGRRETRDDFPPNETKSSTNTAPSPKA